MKHCKTCRRNLEDSAYEAEYKTCTECRNNKSCPTCNSKFSTTVNLQRHINSVHLKQKNFQCSSCESKFGQSKDLQTHIDTVHLKLKNYKCDHCE